MKLQIPKIPNLRINTPTVQYESNDQESFKVLFAGDTHYGENYGKNNPEKRARMGYNVLEKYGYDFPFEKIKSVLLESDLAIANLETPLIDVLNTPKSNFSFSEGNRFRTKKSGYWLHWSHGHITPTFLRKYNLTNLSLANNHMLDFGREGLKQTIRTLNEHGIRYFGAGFNSKEAAMPYTENIVVGNSILKLVVLSAFEYREGYAKDFSWYARNDKSGVNPLSIRRVARKIESIREEDNNVYIVVYPHWGGARNYGWKTEAQTRMGHKLIDAGADIVIGHGPHNLQQIEKYRGKWIIYSLGNFMYVARNRYEMWNSPPFSMVVQLTFTENKDINSNDQLISQNQISKHMKIYPIFTDNPAVNFQARFLNRKEFDIICKLLIDDNCTWKPSKKEVKLGTDEVGRFIEISLD